MGYRYSAFDLEFAAERKSASEICEIAKSFPTEEATTRTTLIEPQQLDTHKFASIQTLGAEVRRLARNGELAARHSKTLAIRAGELAMSAVSGFKKIRIG